MIISTKLHKKFKEFKNTAILFGPENSGLSNEDIKIGKFFIYYKNYI